MKSAIQIKGRFINVDVEISEETRPFMGEQVHLVSHTNSDWQYLATPKAVREIQKSGNSTSVMKELEDSLTSDFGEGEEA